MKKDKDNQTKILTSKIAHSKVSIFLMQHGKVDFTQGNKIFYTAKLSFEYSNCTYISHT